MRSPLWRRALRRRALRASWRAMMVMAFVYRRTLVRGVRVVAVIGSYGKSTAVRTVAAALDVPAERRHPAHTLLRLRPRNRYAVIEVGINRPGQMARFARALRPDVVVVMSVGTEHNRRLRDLDVTRDEKAAMVRALRRDGLAVLNGDDPNVRWMATQSAAATVTFGFDEDNRVRASDVTLDWPRGTRMTVHAGGQARPANVQLLGRHMAYPVLAAVAVANAEHIEIGVALDRIATVPPTPRRLEPRPLPSGAHLLMDNYKSALETVDAALDVFAEIPARRKIAVMGDVEEPPGRTLAAVEEMYDRLTERVTSVASQVIAVHVDAGPRPLYGAPRVTSVRDALDDLPDDLGEGDVVLLKGARQQRFERIEFALAGRPVRCNIPVCNAWIECAACPMLERGWDPST